MDKKLSLATNSDRPAPGGPESVDPDASSSSTDSDTQAQELVPAGEAREADR